MFRRYGDNLKKRVRLAHEKMMAESVPWMLLHTIEQRRRAEP